MIGVLALQGDFEAHLKALSRAGVAARPVRTAEAVRESHGLVIPGGESTTLRKLMEGTGLEEAIREVARRGDPVLRNLRGRHPPGRERHEPRRKGARPPRP